MKNSIKDQKRIEIEGFSKIIIRGLSLILLLLIFGNKMYSQSEGENFSITDRYEYLKLKTKTLSLDMIEGFLGKKEYVNGYNPNAGWTFDAELGWVLQDAIRFDGIYKSATFYHYEESGARKRINFPDQKARIQAYGNSFTHCDQVSDGETWEEYLAAHLREPIENFGVGGYSVYQAFLRMKKIQKTHPSKYIILNIWDDDHFRNLDSWWSIRHNVNLNSKIAYCRFTVPHVRVNIEKNLITEIPNVCQKPEDVYKLIDVEWLKEKFIDDPILGLMSALQKKDSLKNISVEEAENISFGLPHGHGVKAFSEDDLRQTHTKAALFSTIKILDMLKMYIEANDKKLIVILSYGRGNVKSYLSGEKPFDRELLDYLKEQDYPYIDLRQAHLEEFKNFNLSPDEYLSRYYIGHYAPAGNFFMAMAIREKIVQWLDPTPKPYQGKENLEKKIQK